MNKSFLEDCEQEVLHLSGAIQPHGTLMLLDPAGKVSHVAANIADFLEGDPKDWLNKPLPPALDGISLPLALRTGSRVFVEHAIRGPAGLVDVVVTRGENGTQVIEITRSQEPPLLAPPVWDTAGLTGDLETIMLHRRNWLVEQISVLTGAHRVMYYAFHHEGDGEVLAEVCEKPDWGSYLGLHFPASDIPLIARQLYLKNPWRLIPDACAKPVDLLCDEAAGLADLTYSDLRSVSPMHMLYLANMGVRASLSFPVVVNKHLVALVAAHHQDAIDLPPRLLGKIAVLVQEFSHSLADDLALKRMRLLDGLSWRFARVQSVLQRHGDLFDAWPELANELMEEFKSDGATLCFGNDSASLGQCFDPVALAEFDGWFCYDQAEFVWVTDSLSSTISDLQLSEISGVLAIRLGRGAGKGIRIYLTRREQMQEVAWGGNPNKPVEYHDGKIGIAPRRSFEKWIEKRMGYSRPWNSETRLLGLKLRELLAKEVLG